MSFYVPRFGNVEGPQQMFLRLSASGGAAAVQQLIDAGYDLASCSLWVVAAAGEVPLLKALLASGKDPNARGSMDRTPLMEAAENGRVGAMLALLEAGADVQAASVSGMTPLHLAVLSGSEEAVHLLLCFNADPSAEAPDGRTPLNIAVTRQQQAIVAALLEGGASLESDALLTQAVERSSDIILEMLLKAGARSWGNALIAAASRKRPHKLQLLLAACCPVGCTDAQGSTALHAAAENGHARVVSTLLSAGAAPHARRPADGMTPLHCACSAQQPGSCVGLLLEAGCDPNAVTSEQHGRFTPLHLAAIRDFDSGAPAVAALVAAGSSSSALAAHGETPLIAAAAAGSLSAAAFLLQHGADINQTSADGRTALHYAAGHPPWDLDFQLLDLLLKAGAQIDAVTTQTLNSSALRGAGAKMGGYRYEKEGAAHSITPLHLAAESGSNSSAAKFANALLDAGADPDAPDSAGVTPLMVAAASGGMHVLAALIAADGDTEAVDAQGSTALHAAAGVKYHEGDSAVALLLSAGAQANCANSLGQLPAYVALAAEAHRGAGAVNCVRIRLLHEAAAHPARQRRLAAARPCWDSHDTEERAVEAEELLEAARELLGAGGKLVDRGTQHPPAGDQLAGAEAVWRPGYD